MISFIQNVSKRAVEVVGRACGMLAGDWGMATQWLTVPEEAQFGEDICTAFRANNLNP